MPMQRRREPLWRKRLRALARFWAAAERGEVEGVHQLRVASRRVQEALPLVSDGRHRRRVKRADRRVRGLRRALGPVRERDVSLSLLGDIESAHPEMDSAARLVRHSIQAERAEALRRAADYLGERSPQDLTRKLTRAVGEKPFDDVDAAARRAGTTWEVSLAARVVRRARELEEAVDHAGALYAADRLHEARVAGKKLRYALELGHEARLRRWDSAVRTLKQIQDGLGALQDCETLLGHVRSVSAAQPTDESLDRLTRLLEQEAREHHARYLRQRSRLLKLCARVRRQASEALPLGSPGPRSLSAGSVAPPDERAPDGAEPLARTNSP